MAQWLDRASELFMSTGDDTTRAKHAPPTGEAKALTPAANSFQTSWNMSRLKLLFLRLFEGKWLPASLHPATSA